MGASATVDRFLKLFEEHSGTEVVLETRIEDLNLDSLEFLVLVQEISEKFGPVSEELISRSYTVEEILAGIK